MKKTKATIAAMLLIISMLAIAYVPTTSASPAAPQHTATVSPTVTTDPQVKYVFNVTSKASDNINKTKIIFPAGFTNVSSEQPTGWTAAWNWPNVTFTSDNVSQFTAANQSKLFNVTVRWPAVPPTTATFGVDCYKDATASLNNTVTQEVSFNPKFGATIDPTHVKGSTIYIFNITTTCVTAGTWINYINVTYPPGWSYNLLVDYSPRDWYVTPYPAKNTFKLTGPSITKDESMTIIVNMTTATTSQDPSHWNSTAWNMDGDWLGTYDLPVVVDAVAPAVTIDKPTDGYYSVGSGNYIWVNVTVSDDLNITKYGMNVEINDTSFEPHPTKPREKIDDFNYTYFFVNKTSISDGPLAVNVTATDEAGNVGSAVKSTTVDNTPPSLLWIKVKDQTAELPYAAGDFWMSAASTSIQVNASFYNPAGVSGNVYFNATLFEAFDNDSLTSAYSVTGVDYVILNITVTDGASPTANNFTQTWDIYRDEVLPSAPTFTIEAISGGAVITNITATDNVGILNYTVYVNSTIFVTVFNETWTVDNATRATAFNETLVLNLTEVYAGEVANVTIRAVDYGANEGNFSTPVIIDIPEGLWYPITLTTGWNLISLPLVPNNSSIGSVLSRILANLDVVWSYDTETETWFSYSPGVPSTLTQIVDGKGYWVNMTAAITLIIDGSELPLPPALPPAYKVVLGWNLIGFKEITTMNASDYLAGVTWVRMYDYYDGRYHIVLPADDMVPGRGYWIAVTVEGWIYP